MMRTLYIILFCVSIPLIAGANSVYTESDSYSSSGNQRALSGESVHTGDSSAEVQIHNVTTANDSIVTTESKIRADTYAVEYAQISTTSHRSMVSVGTSSISHRVKTIATSPMPKEKSRGFFATAAHFFGFFFTFLNK